MSHLHRVLIRILPIVVLWVTASWVHVVETSRTAHIPKNDNINNPYYVAIKILLDNGKVFTICSGAIIDHTTVLTVAQCKNSFSHDDVIIIVAGTTQYINDNSGDKYNIDKFYRNIKFDEQLLINDIAIVKIKGMFTFSKAVQPIAMAGKATRIYPGSKVQVLGSALLKGLTSVEVKIGDFDICKNYYTLQDVEINSKYHFCAGDLDTDTSPYLIGSLLVKDDILLGLASFGSKNPDRHTLPYIFTDISKYRDWISLNS